MKQQTFSGHCIYSTNKIDENINIDQILKEYYQNTENFNYTHYINKRWENIYLDPQLIPSVLPLLSFALSTTIEVFRDILEPHQTLIIPHELLGYEKNEFWFNTASEGQSTGIHNHIKQATISGVFYLQVPVTSANLFFKSGPSNELEVIAETGKLILFPSELDHYVPTNKCRENRISIAFNCYKLPVSASVLHRNSI